MTLKLTMIGALLAGSLFGGVVQARPLPNHSHSYVVARGEDPWAVAREIRAQVEQTGRELRFEVRRGRVEPAALSVLATDRREIERTLAAASRNGFINPYERAQLQHQVRAIRDLHDQYRCARPASVSYWR